MISTAVGRQPSLNEKLLLLQTVALLKRRKVPSFEPIVTFQIMLYVK